jgi:hypothetical protein
VTFDRAAKRAKTGPLSEPVAGFRFLYVVGRTLELARLADMGALEEPSVASARTRKSALVHVAKLLACMDEGVRLQGSENGLLRRALEQLQTELELTERKPRKDGTYAARRWTTDLLDGFLKEFGTPLPAVACHLAPLLGYRDGVENRTIEKLAAERRERLIKRRAPPPKTARR